MLLCDWTVTVLPAPVILLSALVSLRRWSSSVSRSSFPLAVPCSGIPFPPQGPSSRFPCFIGTAGCSATRRPSCLLRCLRLQYRPCGRRRRGFPGSWETLAHVPRSLIPAEPPRSVEPFGLAALLLPATILPSTAWVTVSASATAHFGTQSRDPRARCLRFVTFLPDKRSSGHARLATGWWSTFAGQASLSCWVSS